MPLRGGKCFRGFFNLNEMENIRLQQRVEDLENALKNIKKSIDSTSRIDNSCYSVSTFEDGFNHAMRLVNGTVETFINPQLNK